MLFSCAWFATFWRSLRLRWWGWWSRCKRVFFYIRVYIDSILLKEYLLRDHGLPVCLARILPLFDSNGHHLLLQANICLCLLCLV